MRCPLGHSSSTQREPISSTSAESTSLIGAPHWLHGGGTDGSLGFIESNMRCFSINHECVVAKCYPCPRTLLLPISPAAHALPDHNRLILARWKVAASGPTRLSSFKGIASARPGAFHHLATRRHLASITQSRCPTYRRLYNFPSLHNTTAVTINAATASHGMR